MNANKFGVPNDNDSDNDNDNDNYSDSDSDSDNDNDSDSEGDNNSDKHRYLSHSKMQESMKKTVSKLKPRTKTEYSYERYYNERGERASGRLKEANEVKLFP